MKSQQQKEHFEAYLKEKATQYFQEKSILDESILYSLLGPGKRIRPLLCLGFSQGMKGNSEVALASGLAVEMIHAYSLIHDDLPAMDNDDFRRGRPTNHKVYGEAMAILAGDSLLNCAPEFLLQQLKNLKVDPALTVNLVSSLLASSGHRGMVKGQALDMKYESVDLTGINEQDRPMILQEIHDLKTGAIITWSCVAGLYSSLDENLILRHFAKVESIGKKIGLLFQMIDDVLDVTANFSHLGKTPGKDEKAGKLTYVNLHGLEKTRELAGKLAHEIHLELSPLSGHGDWSLINGILQDLESKLA